MDKNIEKDAQDLRNAMKGFGTNEKEIIRITMSHTKKERQTLRLAYKTCFGRDLMDDLSKELSGNFKDTILALYEDPIEYDAKCLYKAMKGLGTDEDTLIEIICTRPNWMLKAISEAFLRLYKKELSKWVESETSGDFRRILLSLLQCNRSENTHPNDDLMKQNAHQLYTAGEGRLGTDEAFFNKIFAVSSPPELFAINQWYTKLSGKNLRDSIDREFSGDIKKALQTILDGIICPSEYFARRVNKAVKGLGTNNSMLIRVLVSREEVDIKEMMIHYKAIIKQDMIKDIIDDTSGHYKEALVAICQNHA